MLVARFNQRNTDRKNLSTESSPRLMKNAFSRLTVATLLCLCCLTASFAAGQDTESEPVGGKVVVVQDKFGGQIFGYDIDRNGTEGMLSEIVGLSDGNLMLATETFDQKTGKIIKVVHKKTETQDNFITLGIEGSHVGLEEVEHVKGIFVDKLTFDTINPLNGNKLTAPWTPPIDGKTQGLEDIEADQGTPNVAVMASPYSCCARFVFGSDVGANTFGKKIALTGDIFNQGVPPLLAFDSKTNQAVLAQAQGAPFTVPEVLLVDLVKGKITEFTGLGFGFVNGLAVDSTTGIACTTTETDNSAEFYNLKKKTGVIVVLPVIGQYSGAAVAVDPVHKLFFITHPVPGAPGQIHIYDEKGNLVTSITGIAMGPSGVYVALNPSTRTGFVQVAGSNGNSSGLQSFTY
jgi:hypothetical protein